VGTFKDSGDRQQFSTGAVRDASRAKGRFDLLPPFALALVACIFEDGSLKYAARNWEGGIPVGRFVDSAMRHLEKYQAGLRDEPHLSMAAWNVLCALWTACMVRLGLRDAALFDLPNHIGNEPAQPLSPYEEMRLEKFLGRPLPAPKPTEDNAS